MLVPKLRSFVPKLQCLVPKLGCLVPELSRFIIHSRNVDGELGGLFPDRENHLGGGFQRTLREFRHETAQESDSPGPVLPFAFRERVDDTQMKQRLIAIPTRWHKLKITFVITRSGNIIPQRKFPVGGLKSENIHGRGGDVRTDSGTSRASSIGVDSDKALQLRVQLLYTLIAFLHFQRDLRRCVRFDFGEFFVELRDVVPKLRSFVPKLRCLVPKLRDLVPELSHFIVQSRDVDRELGGLFPGRKNHLGGGFSGL